MTIGIDATRANQSQKTGVERYAFHIIEALKQITPESVRVILYTERPLEGSLANLPKHWESCVLRWPPRRFWTQIRLSFEMLVDPPDVLFIPGHVFPIIHPKKTVMTVHDIAAWRFPETYNWFERWYSLWSASYAAKKLWQVIVPTNFGKQELMSFVDEKHGQPISGNSITVVHHGPTATLGKVLADEDVRNRYVIEKPYLFFCGRIEEKKNLVFLIRTFSFLKENFASHKNISDLSLILVGKKGTGGEAVFNAAAASTYNKQIHFFRTMPDDHRDALMRQALLIVYLSKYEGFGMPILEGFGAGTPVVVSNTGALTEVGADAVAVCDIEDPQVAAKMLFELIQNEQVRQQFIQKGKERLQTFSWEKAAQETLAVLAGG